jgi:DNA-directed RNA polymerase specialized sigma24 family protein
LLDVGLEVRADERAEGDTSATDRRIERILARLAERYCDVLTHRFRLNYSVKETAAELGMSESSVKVI